MFIDLGGHRHVWCNVDQIVRIEPAIHEGAPVSEPSKIVWAVTFSDGSQRGITEEEFNRIMIISNAPR